MVVADIINLNRFAHFARTDVIKDTPKRSFMDSGEIGFNLSTMVHNKEVRLNPRVPMTERNENKINKLTTYVFYFTFHFVF